MAGNGEGNGAAKRGRANKGLNSLHRSRCIRLQRSGANRVSNYPCLFQGFGGTMENRAAERTKQVSRYAARNESSALRAPPPTYAAHAATTRTNARSADQRRYQREQSADEPPRDEANASQRLVLAADGSNLAMQFDRKRMRTVHIEPNSARTRPEGEWEPVNLRAILRWIQKTTPPRAHTRVGTFLSIGEAL